MCSSIQLLQSQFARRTMPLPDVCRTAWSCLALVLHTAVQLRKPYSPHDLDASLLLTVPDAACCMSEPGRQWRAVLMVILSIHRQRNPAFKHSSVAKAQLCSKALVSKMSLVSMFACLLPDIMLHKNVSMDLSFDIPCDSC